MALIEKRRDTKPSMADGARLKREVHGAKRVP